MSMPINAAVIQNGKVVNIVWILQDQLEEFNAVEILIPEVGIGWCYENGVFINPNPDIIEENTIEG